MYKLVNNQAMVEYNSEKKNLFLCFDGFPVVIVKKLSTTFSECM